jgi:serine phosphatase RsbU (regulator of sigma subunit)
VLLFALVGLGALATVLSIREEREAVRLGDDRAADLAASRLSGALQQTLGALRGADALVVDGVVDDEVSLYDALAYSTIVAATDRAAFEASTGLTVRDTDGAGGLVPAAARARHVVVVDVYPRSEATEGLLGFDIASDPTRRDAAELAERSREPTVSDQISLAGSARPGIFLIHAVRTPGGATVGFVTSGISVDALVASASLGDESGTRFELSLDTAVLAGSSTSGESTSFDVAGRTFVVEVDEGRRVNLVLPVVIGVGTVLLAAAATAAFRRDRRQGSRLALGERRSRGIAELGQRLAASTDSDGVVTQLLRHAGAILDADHVNVGRRADDDPSKLTVLHDAGMNEVLASHFGVQDLETRLPLTDCVKGAAAVTVSNLADYRARYPHVIDDVEAARISSVLCVPLMFAEELCVGAIGFAWAHSAGETEMADRLVAATTIAELASRALERAVITEAVQSSAANLSTFAQALAAAHTIADVERAVARHVAPIFNARSAALQLLDGAHEDALEDAGGHQAGNVRRTIRDADGRATRRLTLDWPAVIPPSATEHAVLTTIAELVSQTMARATLSDQEHQLIVRLQQDLLPPPVDVPGLDVAVRYRPAMNVVGLGGDFYDLVVSDAGRIYFVIGDVTGHGSEAVTAMAELKAVMNNLLRSDTPMENVCAQADTILARRETYATAQIVEVDPAAGTIRYLNAGHPNPIMSPSAGSATLLLDGHRPLLGLTGRSSAAVAACCPFGPDDVLVLYTDGLIERRTQPLELSMRQLARRIEQSGAATMEALLDEIAIVDEAVAAENVADDKTDDDVAVIGVRVLP